MTNLTLKKMKHLNKFLKYLIILFSILNCSCMFLINEPDDPGIPTATITKDIPLIYDGDYYIKMVDLNLLGARGNYMLMNNDIVYSLDSNKLTKINPETFEIKESYKIANGNVSYILGSVNSSTENFWLLYAAKNTTINTGQKLLSLINSTGKAIYTFDFESENPRSGEYTISATSDNGCIIGCMDLYKKYILKFDGKANLIWKNTYPKDLSYLDQTSSTTRIIELKSKDFLYCRVIRNSGYYVPSYSSKISRLDRDGKLKWEKQFTPSFTLKTINNLVEQSDNSYILTDNSGNLTKIDSTGNIIWELNFPNCFIVKTIISNNGSIIVCYNNPINGNDISLSKISDVGIIEWTNTYGGTGSERANNIFNLTSREFFIMGRTSNLSGNWKRIKEYHENNWLIYYVKEIIDSGYFIKTDENGVVINNNNRINN